MKLGWQVWVQSIVALLIITDPLTRGVFFRLLTEGWTKEQRARGVVKVTVAVGLILGVSALVGRELLEIIGINLGAFAFTGGLIVAAMGLEMMSGENSRMQGGKRLQEAPEEDDALLVPFSMPFIAGPGAITTVITIASKTNTWESTIMALVSVGVVLVLLPIGLSVFSRVDMKRSTQNVVTRFGGLIVATIGVQLAFGGIKTFFELK